MEDIFNSAKQWVLQAGAIIKNSFTDEISVEFKTSASDLVTRMDREIELFFIDNISEKYPDHFVLGEEGVSNKNDYNSLNEIVWIIDPIDGTTNFVNQQRNFAISVAIVERGVPKIGFIYDPVEDELFYAIKGTGAFLNDTKLEYVKEVKLDESLISFNHIWLTPNDKCDYLKLQNIVTQSRGTRCIGSASLEMAYVACSRLNAYIDFRLSPWDIAAGLVILEEVGAVASTVQGQKVNVFSPNSTIFSHPVTENKLVNLLL